MNFVECNLVEGEYWSVLDEWAKSQTGLFLGSRRPEWRKVRM